MDKDKLAKNLTLMRRAAEFGQEEAAEKLGITAKTLYNYETGQTIPDYITAWKMADLYGVSIDALGGRIEWVQP